jgi:hypothetical protein
MTHPTPHERYVGYPRSSTDGLYGSADRLEALADGYFGLIWVGIFASPAMTLFMGHHFHPLSPTGVGGVVLISLATSALTLRGYLKIATGKGWNAGLAVIPALLMLANLPLWAFLVGGTFTGTVGYGITYVAIILPIEFAVRSEFKRYGFKFKPKDRVRFFWAIYERRLAEENAPPPPVPANMFTGEPPKSL